MDLTPVPGVAQLVTAICLLVGVYTYRNGTPTTQAVGQIPSALAVGVLPFVLGLKWLELVTKAVPEPYLDEVFHIPQAQVYCQGRYNEWDDKITTPPGLYLLSIWLIHGTACSARNLRLTNVGIVASIAVVVTACLGLTARKQPTLNSTLNSRFTGINIALFPVIFFFSGLYYTDGASTLVVLLAYWVHLARARGPKEQPSFLSDLATIILGILALFMRQTNIFWVVVYMGGLEAVQAVKSLSPNTATRPQSDAIADQVKSYLSRYASGEVHDPSLDETTPIVDIALCAVSLVIAGVCNILPILRRIWAHITVLVAFVGFVVWNGGVVLGDKSNHVATLHLAQMLYIWPLFVFFSVPLFLLPLLQLVKHSWHRITAQKSHDTPSGLSQPTTITVAAGSHLLQGGLVLVAALGVAALVVRFSTIIHPFTLADNRHYMFYVFRYSILRAWWIRYALVPVYIACAWLCWIALQGCWQNGPAAAVEQAHQHRRWICSPWAELPTAPQGPHAATRHLSTAAPTASTVLILLIATTLSLMTAPLVEPRYFILPWVFWRLLVPAWPSSTTAGFFVGQSSSPSPAEVAAKAEPSTTKGNATVTDDGSVSGPWWTRIDPQLVLETLWFGAINSVTMYIFITRPFYWKNPDGSLADGGRVQRFMW